MVLVMSSCHILDKVSDIFWVFKYFQVFLCVLCIFLARPEKPDPKPNQNILITILGPTMQNPNRSGSDKIQTKPGSFRRTDKL